MTAASPGVIALFLNNEYFPGEEDYLYALAEVMRDEYRAIVEAGFVLQIDCPDLAMGRTSQFAHLSLDDFRKVVELHVEVLNYALGDIQSRVPGSGVRGRGSGERETTASSLAGKEESSRKEDNSGQGKDGPAGAIAQGGNGR